MAANFMQLVFRETRFHFPDIMNTKFGPGLLKGFTDPWAIFKSCCHGGLALYYDDDVKLAICKCSHIYLLLRYSVLIKFRIRA